MVSALKGPIPPHPYYAGAEELKLNLSAPRVRPEARDTYERSQGSIVLECRGENISVDMHYGTKQQKASKDHIRENVRRMRQVQRAARKKEEAVEPPKPVKALWKSDKYNEVGSRIAEDREKPPATPRPSTANFLRAHSRTGFIPKARPCSASPREVPVEKLTVPKASTAPDVLVVRRDVDFIKTNGIAARRSQLRSSSGVEAPEHDDLRVLKQRDERLMSGYRRGYMPKYLVSRQSEWAAEEEHRARNQPDPDQPEGHRRMSHEERLNTLQLLRDNHGKLISQINSMPIRTDTLRVRTQKEELQRKLVEVEEAIKIFERPKVFVKAD